MLANPSFHYAVARPADAAAIARELSLAFSFSTERAAEYVGNIGLTSFRVLIGSDGVAASAALVPTGHFFGGRSVPAANICHVAIAPQWRGQGLARFLLAEMEGEALSNGAVMATLFASARPVYRKIGYELAGSEIIYEAETSGLPARATASFQVITGDIAERLSAATASRTAIHNGLLDRAPQHWRELFKAPRHALAAYAIDGDVRKGHVLIDTADEACLTLRDWHASGGRAAEAILAFVSGFRSVYPRMRWHGAPQDDLVFAMPDKGWKLIHQEEWMAKLLAPEKALAARGYTCQDESMDFTLTGAEGERTFGLTVSGGKAGISKPLGKDSVALPESHLAPLFSGFRSARFLARAQRLSGSAAAIAACDRIFAGPSPWTAEHF